MLLFSTLPYLNVALWIILFFFLVSLQINISGKVHNKITDGLRATIDSVMNALAMILASFFSWIIYQRYTSINSIYAFFACVFFAVFVLNTLHSIINKKNKLYEVVDRAN